MGWGRWGWLEEGVGAVGYTVYKGRVEEKHRGAASQTSGAGRSGAEEKVEEEEETDKLNCD